MRFGGDILDSGSYGCVFYPSLKCNNTRSSKKYISKLMTIKDATNEYNNIQQIKSIVDEKLPNHRKYMILSDEICRAPQLSPSDLKSYEKCYIFKKMGISKNNINNHIKDFVILNQSYGGEELGVFFQKQREKEISQILLQSIKLLMFCIIPLNKLKIYHLDLKSNNILIKKKQLFVIDWGLSEINPSIETFRYNKFAFNIPFGNVVFGETFSQMCNFKVSREEAKKCVVQFMNYYKDGKDSLKTIEEIMKLLGKNHMECIENYLIDIITKYTKEEYFEIYLHNADFWGFASIFIDILEIFKQYRGIISPIFHYVYTHTGYLEPDVFIETITTLSKYMKKSTKKTVKRKRSTITNTSRNFKS